MMSSNSENIERLAEKSSEIDMKIDLTSKVLRNNIDTSRRSVEDSEIMANKINEIIAKVSEMSRLSQKNQDDIKQITGITGDLYTAATDLNAKLGQFKS